MHDRQPIRPVAGCTDIFVSLHFGTLGATRFLNLWNLAELRRIRRGRDVLSIGALATYRQITASSLVRAWLPILVSAAREVGSVQIQNRGTLGGNIVNASPAGDTLPVLAVADAVLVLGSLGSLRRVPLTSFYTGYRQTVMRPDELLLAIEIPPVEGCQYYRKVGTRAAQAVSKVVIAALRSPRPRVALGSVAPTVVRLTKTEAVLAAGGSLEEAQAALQTEIDPIDDIRSTAAYRRRVSANLLAAFWQLTAHQERNA